MSYNSNKISGESNECLSATYDGAGSLMVCEQNESSSQCGQSIRTGASDVSYGFYS
jgi:hypothetical protein